jgi:hypothetical protein
MRWQRLAVVALAVVLAAGGASAALKKYQIRTTNISASLSDSPPNVRITQLPGPPGIAVIDDTTPGSPVLRRFTEVEDGTNTYPLGLHGYVLFLSTNRTEGPTGEFTGTGSTDATIVWGVVSGWTVTGTYWCNASTAFFCGAVDFAHRESVDPWIHSPFYDLGTWTFHGTGFTATPFVFWTFEYEGNYQHVYRGLRVLNGSVPAVPAVGIAAVGASLLAIGLTTIRRR